MSHLALGLGTNLGDRLRALRAAVSHINNSGSASLLRFSDVFESPPWGVHEQPRFLNACVTIQTSLSFLELLDLVKEIERAMGRQPRDKWGPREIDIDILLSEEGSVIDAKEIAVPHAYLAERDFVLHPLAQIAPDWTHPLLRATVRQLAERVDGSQLRRITAL